MGFPHRQPAPITAQDFRFTTRNGTLYACGFVWPGHEAVLRSFGQDNASVQKVTLLESRTPLRFAQQADGLHVQLPENRAADGPYVLKIEGSSALGTA
ncbi:MAG: alpha-L-fucosidase C-terminal domain-containing protein [Acidobacteriaceae bacterium]